MSPPTCPSIRKITARHASRIGSRKNVTLLIFQRNTEDISPPQMASLSRSLHSPAGNCQEIDKTFCTWEHTGDQLCSFITLTHIFFLLSISQWPHIHRRMSSHCICPRNLLAISPLLPRHCRMQGMSVHCTNPIESIPLPVFPPCRFVVFACSLHCIAWQCTALQFPK